MSKIDVIGINLCLICTKAIKSVRGLVWGIKQYIIDKKKYGNDVPLIELDKFFIKVQFEELFKYKWIDSDTIMELKRLHDIKLAYSKGEI